MTRRRLFPNWGLSPRVRGNLDRVHLNVIRHGSIPACAGEPTRPGGQTRVFTVYPRVCGGTISTGAMPEGFTGLSPRVRGNPYHADLWALDPWSIPACAGEPPSPKTADPARTVYPRVCGGTDTVT